MIRKETETLLISMLILLVFTGCASVQVKYTEKEPRQSVVKEYTVIKKNKKSWETVETKSFPIFRALKPFQNLNSPEGDVGILYLIALPFDLALLPFQVLYDIPRYESNYYTQLVVSGRFIDKFGKPISNKRIKVSVGDELSDEIFTDNQGNFEKKLELISPSKLKKTQELIFNISDFDTDKFYVGNKQTIITPLKTKFIINASANIININRQDLLPSVKKEESQDGIETNWITQVQSGDIITLRESMLYSERNKQITIQDERQREQEKEEEEARQSEQRRQTEVKNANPANEAEKKWAIAAVQVLQLVDSASLLAKDNYENPDLRAQASDNWKNTKWIFENSQPPTIETQKLKSRLVALCDRISSAYQNKAGAYEWTYEIGPELQSILGELGDIISGQK